MHVHEYRRIHVVSLPVPICFRRRYFIALIYFALILSYIIFVPFFLPSYLFRTRIGFSSLLRSGLLLVFIGGARPGSPRLDTSSFYYDWAHGSLALHCTSIVTPSMLAYLNLRLGIFLFSPIVFTDSPHLVPRFSPCFVLA